MKTNIIKKIQKYVSKCNKSTTHECMAFSLLIGQCFSLFPVDGIGQPDPHCLRFNCLSCKVIYHVVFLIGVLGFIGLHVYYVTFMVPKFTFGCLVMLIYLLECFVSCVFILLMSRSWPRLMVIWNGNDKLTNTYGNLTPLYCQLRVVTVMVLSAACVDYALYTYLTISHLPEGWSIDDMLNQNFSLIFTFIPYSMWKGLIFSMINFTCIFTWTYVDLLLMIICISLAEKYRQINKGIAKAINTNVRNIAFWKKVRQDYGSVFKLCQAVDDHISKLLILSFANNILVILVQLYNSITLLRGNGSGIDRVHFIYAFFYIICRASAVSLFAASINEEGKAALKHLFNVSTEAYNVEVEKLLQKIYVDPPIITGKRLFYLEKPLILHIAIAIVSYELILIQFKVII